MKKCDYCGRWACRGEGKHALRSGSGTILGYYCDKHIKIIKKFVDSRTMLEAQTNKKMELPC